MSLFGSVLRDDFDAEESDIDVLQGALHAGRSTITENPRKPPFECHFLVCTYSPESLNFKTTTRDPNRIHHQKWCLIAEKIEKNPDLLAIPMRNLERWLQTRSDGLGKLREWKEMIEAAQTDRNALSSLLNLLRDDSEEARALKSYSPFPGILNSEEVDRFTCAWRH